MDTHKKILSRNKRKPTNTISDVTRKWATFTYVGKEIRTITRLFKNTNLHIAYKTKSTLQKHLQLKNIDPGKCNYSGIF
jgi:hypothetical protein